MSVYGQKKPPYHREGVASCLANIHRDCEKLRCIIGEIPPQPYNYDRMLGILAIETIGSCLLVLEEIARRLYGVGEVEQGGEVNKL
jgi:hypothetical protein